MLFHELEYFIMVAECLNYSLAAQKLYISQPGLSKVISGLERDLGVRLFQRSTRKVELTEAGMRFYTLSKTYLEQCQALTKGQTPDTLIGALSIVFGNVVDSVYMPRIISAFSERFPGISVTTNVQNAEELLRDIRHGKTDIGMLSSCAVGGQGIQKLLLCPRKLQIIVWKDHPLADRQTIRLEELRDEWFIFMHPSVNRGGDTLTRLCSAAGFTPHVMEYTTDFRLMFMLTAQKKGVSFNLTLHDVASYPNLRSIDVDLTDHPEFEKNAGLVLVWHEKNSNPALEYFLKIAQDLQPKLLEEQAE